MAECICNFPDVLIKKNCSWKTNGFYAAAIDCMGGRIPHVGLTLHFLGKTNNQGLNLWLPPSSVQLGMQQGT